jgi:hypothetical protein
MLTNVVIRGVRKVVYVAMLKLVESDGDGLMSNSVRAGAMLGVRTVVHWGTCDV